MKLNEFLKPNNVEFSKSDKKIYEVILKHPAHVQLITIQKLATDAQTSVASVQRYCKKLGYTGFKEFKFQLKNYLLQQLNFDKNNSSYLSNYLKVANSFKNIEEDKISNLAEALVSSNHNYIIGVYYSSMPAKQLAMGMQDLNKVSFYTDNYVNASHWVGLIEEEDAFVVFSVSGNDPYIKKYISEPLSKLSRTYLITFNPDTKLSKYFKNCIVLPGKAFANSSAIDPQSLFSLFVEMVINHITSY